MANEKSAFLEFRIEPRENRVEHNELGTVIVASHVDDDRWSTTIRALDATGSRYLGGGHRILMEPLSYGGEPAVVARLVQGKVVVRALSDSAYQIRFTPSSSARHVDATLRAAFTARPGASQPAPRWFRAADPATRIRIEEDSTGATVDVYVNEPSTSEIVLVLRGEKRRVTLQPDGATMRGTLQVGYQIGNDLYVA